MGTALAWLRLQLQLRLRHACSRTSVLLVLWTVLLCTVLSCTLLRKEQEPEVVPLGGRNRPRLPWLRGRPARRAMLNVAAAVAGAACTHVATGSELAVDHRGVLCACTACSVPHKSRRKPSHAPHNHGSLSSGCCHGTQATVSSSSPKVAAGLCTSVASTATGVSCSRRAASAASSSSVACRAASARRARTRSRPSSSRSPWRGASGGAGPQANRLIRRCGTDSGPSTSIATAASLRS